MLLLGAAIGVTCSGPPGQGPSPIGPGMLDAGADGGPNRADDGVCLSGCGCFDGGPPFGCCTRDYRFIRPVHQQILTCDNDEDPANRGVQYTVELRRTDGVAYDGRLVGTAFDYRGDEFGELSAAIRDFELRGRAVFRLRSGTLQGTNHWGCDRLIELTVDAPNDCASDGGTPH
jgi:hypothetical protein